MYKYKFTNIVWDKPLSFLYNKVDNYMCDTQLFKTQKFTNNMIEALCRKINKIVCILYQP